MPIVEELMVIGSVSKTIYRGFAESCSSFTDDSKTSEDMNLKYQKSKS